MAPTIKDIRDGFVRGGNIEPDLFLFFAELFEKYGKLEDGAGNITRTILAKVIKDEDCLFHMLSKTEFYTKLINDAGDDAAPLKEIIQGKISEEPSKELLTTFAQKIG